jgi:putative pyruvate formate lyase activating enzyme
VLESYGPDHGEEDSLRGTRCSETLIFAWCNLRCVYCQNWDIGKKGIGREVSAQGLAGMMLELQVMGCHNINLVGPSQVVAQIIAAVAVAAEKGLPLPLVYNTGGDDGPKAERLLDGIVDIYMPDQYHPCYRADRYLPLDRSLSPEEYGLALAEARRAGLQRFDRPRRW